MLKKLVTLVLVGAVVYFLYVKIIKPFVSSGKSRVNTFYGDVKVPDTNNVK